MNKYIIDEVYSPIEDALKQTNLTIKNIAQIDLIGGLNPYTHHSRRNQKKLGEGIHINSDD